MRCSGAGQRGPSLSSQPGNPRATELTSIAKSGAGAAAWNFVGNLARAGSQFLAGVVLARLLGPEAFGVVAIAWLMIGIGLVFADFGVNLAVIQKHQIEDADLDAAFTLQVAIGIGLTVAGVLIAPALCGFFQVPDGTPAVATLSLLFLVRAVGQTPTAVLQRRLDFRLTQLVALISYFVGFLVIGLAAAFSGWGIWSLVVAQLSQALIAAICLLFASKRRYRLVNPFRRRALMNFSKIVLISNLAFWLFFNVDNMVIGRVFGPVALGYYNRMMMLATTPMTFSTSLQGVLLSMAARAQHDSTATASALTTAMVVVALPTFPILLTVALVADTVTLGLFGPGWMMGASLLPPLAIAMMLNSVKGLFGPWLVAVGHPREDLNANVASLAVLVVSTLAASTVSREAVAWAVAGSYCFRFGFQLRLIATILNVRFVAMLRPFVLPVSVAAWTAAAATLADRSLSLGAFGQFAAVFAVAGVALAIGLVAVARPLTEGPLRDAIQRLRPLPPLIEKFLPKERKGNV